MSHGTVGQWVQLDPSNLVLGTEDSGLQVLPSPYDVPVAVRINEGDPEDPSYAVEVRYLGGSSESTQSQHPTADINVEVGSRSGRVYRVLVDKKLASAGARTQLGALADAVAKVAAYGKSRTPFASNAQMVSKAMQLHERELLSELARLGSFWKP